MAAPAASAGLPAGDFGGYTGDSYCTPSQLEGSAAPTGFDPNGSDYEGPNNTFSNISPDETTGVVNFTSPLLPGQSTYFSLEESLEPGDVAITYGYWMVASDGGIFAYNAPYYGSMGGKPLAAPIVGIGADPATGGYWEVASDGGLFAFNAPFFGSMGGKPLNQPIVAMVATPDGLGYWEVAKDGGIFSFGDAAFYGSMGGKPLNKPIVGISSAANGQGYYEVASDGGLFNFGPGTILPGLHGRQAAQPADGGHGVVGEWLPGGGVRRRPLRLQRTLLRLAGVDAAQQAGGRDGGDARWRRLLGGGNRRWDLQLR